MTSIPYIAVAKETFQYTDGKEAFEVLEGDAFSGLLCDGALFVFSIFLKVPDSTGTYPMEVHIPHNTTRFNLYPLANSLNNAHHTERK